MNQPARIAHPAAQNMHILRGVERVAEASLYLTQQGFTILGIAIKRRMPVIRIQGERRCKQFDATLCMIRGRAAGQRSNMMIATVKGAQVEWEEQS